MKLTFENLYDKYNEYVMSIARSILNDDELAKDAFQETFVSVAQNIDTIDDNPHKAKSFIKKTAKNAAICIYRKYKVIRRVETAFPDENGNANNNEERHTRIPEELRTESFENELIKKYDMKILMESLSELDDKYSIYIKEYYYRKMSYEQIAIHHKISKEAAKKRVYRSRDKLTDLFEKKEGENKNE